MCQPECVLKKLCASCVGFADYGVSVNPSKTRLSFDMTTSSGVNLQVSNSLYLLVPLCMSVLALL